MVDSNQLFREVSKQRLLYGKVEGVILCEQCKKPFNQSGRFPVMFSCGHNVCMQCNFTHNKNFTQYKCLICDKTSKQAPQKNYAFSTALNILAEVVDFNIEEDRVFKHPKHCSHKMVFTKKRGKCGKCFEKNKSIKKCRDCISFTLCLYCSAYEFKSKCPCNNELETDLTPDIECSKCCAKKHGRTCYYCFYKLCEECYTYLNNVSNKEINCNFDQINIQSPNTDTKKVENKVNESIIIEEPNQNEEIVIKEIAPDTALNPDIKKPRKKLNSIKPPLIDVSWESKSLRLLMSKAINGSSELFFGNKANGKREGYGSAFYPTGSNYNGEWLSDNRHGLGIYYQRDGEIYSGDFKDNTLEGKGCCKYTDGSKYQGEWKNGTKEGHGKYYYANGDTYDGEWKEGLQEGKGEYIWTDGSKFQGKWSMGEMMNGVFTYTSGDRYEGSYLGGLKHGKGVYYFQCGIKVEAEWEEGEVVYEN